MKTLFESYFKTILNVAVLVMLVTAAFSFTDSAHNAEWETYPAFDLVTAGVYRLPDSSRIWYVENGTYHLVESPEALFAQGYNWGDVQPIDYAYFATLRTGANLSTNPVKKVVPASVVIEKLVVEIVKPEPTIDYRQKLIDLSIKVEGEANAKQYQMSYDALKHMPNVSAVTIRYEDGINQCGDKKMRAFGCTSQYKKTMRINTQMHDRYFTGVLVHEYGHTLGLERSFPQDAPAITKYGKSNVHENFAEHFTAYVLKGNMYRQLAITDPQWQKTYAFFQNYFDEDFDTGDTVAFHPSAIYLGKYTYSIKLVEPVAMIASK